MPRYKCTVQYDGKNYIGWQAQPNGLGIQELIEMALSSICNDKIEIVSAGRTDAKVHAQNQVFHFDSERKMPKYNWLRALNTQLPDDIFIKDIERVADDFHSRFHAIGKEYEYLINLGDYDVFLNDRAFQSPHALDVDYMEKCSKIFVGTHDFSSFCANSFEIHPDQTRKIDSIVFTREGDLLRINFKGKGFMRYMVRFIVGTLIEAGRHHLNYDDIVEILDARDKDACKWSAKPGGLYLVEVKYKR